MKKRIHSWHPLTGFLPLFSSGLFLLFGLTGCFDIEYRGRIYGGGHVRADAVFVLPSLDNDRYSREIFGEGVSSFSELLQKNGVRFDKDRPKKNSYTLETNLLSRLSLPWLAFHYSESDGGSFAYAHGISFPSQIVAHMRRELSLRFRALHSPDRDPEALAEGMLGTGKVLLRWTFPGAVTDTNGVKVDDRTVQWEFRASDLEAGPKVGYALGKIGFLRRLWDRILLFFLRIFAPVGKDL